MSCKSGVKRTMKNLVWSGGERWSSTCHVDDIHQGLELACPPQWRIGHMLNLAVRPNELRNVWYEVQVQSLLGYLMYTKKVGDR